MHIAYNMALNVMYALLFTLQMEFWHSFYSLVLFVSHLRVIQAGCLHKIYSFLADGAVSWHIYIHESKKSNQIDTVIMEKMVKTGVNRLE